MGKKSVAYKRRLRRLQQLRKRGTVDQSAHESRDGGLSHLTETCTGDVGGILESQTEQEGTSDIDNSSTQTAVAVEQTLNEELKKANNKCLELRERLERHTRYYKSKLEVSERKLNNAEEECNKRIHQVRSFWICKIYKEGSRPGKILKMALQQN